ncbi:hypothetical protein K439DRAFT_1624275 [Ramaria rubella]|nr:hypothetical protein K439DRAFT_1624275 [Ramaria rubella]
MSLDFLLTYVETRGRAEPINLMLRDANVNFYDERIPIEEWQTRKKEGKYGPVYGQPFHGLPTLEVQTVMGPFKLAGTYAILDYLDDAFDVHAGRDMLQKGKINMIRDASMAFILDFHALLKSETWDDPEEHAVIHKSKVLPFLLDLSRHISMNGLRKTFGANPATPLTAAGACTFEALDLIESLFPSTLAEWPVLAILWQRIASRPRIEAYIESGKRHQKITMSPYETFERIAIARTHPLTFERKEPTIPTSTDTQKEPPFVRKKKGRQPSRPSTVAGDVKGKGFENGSSWVESKATPPNIRSMADTTYSTDGAFSDTEYVRSRTRSVSRFFSKSLKRGTKDLKEQDKKPGETRTRSNPKRQQSMDRDERSMRSVATLDITRPSRPTTPAIEPALPINTAGNPGMKVAISNARGKHLSSESDYTDDSDVPDEHKARAL